MVAQFRLSSSDPSLTKVRTKQPEELPDGSRCKTSNITEQIIPHWPIKGLYLLILPYYIEIPIVMMLDNVFDGSINLLSFVLGGFDMKMKISSIMPGGFSILIGHLQDEQEKIMDTLASYCINVGNTGLQIDKSDGILL